MSNTFAAVVFAIGLGFGVGCAGGGSGDGTGNVDAALHQGSAVCGDGTCAASELHSCPQDCGTPAVDAAVASVCNNNFTCEPNLGETAANCPNDCGAGSGSDAGMGSGGGLDCVNNPNDFEGCFECLLASVCPAPYDAADCTTCIAAAGGL